MRINLLPPAERGRSRKRVDKLRIAAVLGAGLTVLLLLVTAFNARWAGIYETELTAMEPQVQQMERTQRELAALRRDNDAFRRDVASLAALVGQADTDATVRALIDVAAALPGDAWLTRLSLTVGRNVTLDGYAGSASAITRLVASLRAAPGVTGVELTRMWKLDDGHDAIRSFSLDVALGDAGK